jgi:hypothetical protein
MSAWNSPGSGTCSRVISVGMRKQTHNRWQHKREWWQHKREFSRPSTLTVQCSPLSLSLSLRLLKHAVIR